MGNAKSEQAANYEQHERLGEVRLIEEKDMQGNLVQEMLITRPIQSEDKFNQWIKQLNSINEPIANEVMLLPNKTVFQSKGMCGSRGLVSLKYDHFPYVFQLEMENRRRIHRYFMETEIWFLLYNLVRAGCKFEQRQSKIGDVHPKSILLNDDGLLKVISTCSFPGQSTNFDKYIDNPHEKVFLAPEELEHTLGRMEYPKNINPSTAQCYSIGLTVLAAGTLEDIDSVYATSGDQKKIQMHKVNYFLKLFGERYSSFLHSIVLGLLADNPVNRKRCSQIYQSIHEYQDKILDLEAFIPPQSRLTPTHLHPSYVSQSRVSHDPQRGNYVVSGQQRPSPAMFYSQNGLQVSPIESKYVPMSQYQSTQQQHLSIPPGQQPYRL